MPSGRARREREFFIDNLLDRIHLIIVMMRWTGLAPWEFEFPFPGSITSTFLSVRIEYEKLSLHYYVGTQPPPLCPYTYVPT